MNNNEKIVLGSFISVFLIISILVVYNKNTKNTDTQGVINKTEIPINTTIDSSTDNKEEGIQQVSPTIITDTNAVIKKLIVSPRCIGCGKCARIDSEHFQMNGEISTVISQNNLESQDLQMAISICPTSAISIN